MNDQPANPEARTQSVTIDQLVGVSRKCIRWAMAVFMAKGRATIHWEYGRIRHTRARRHPKTGEVQFVLWQAGERGRTEDCWINWDTTWWPQFVRDPASKVSPDRPTPPKQNSNSDPS
jgi:hypothetical protein